MKILILISLLTLFSCGRAYNSSSSDADRYGSNVTGTAEFMDARLVMVNRCFSCHNHSAWASFDQAAFVSAGLVVGSNLSGSDLYLRIRGNDVSGSGDMPPSETLSTDEINRIKTWILSF